MGDDFLAELLGTFSVEAREHLQVIQRHALTLERSVDPAERERLLSEMFRAAHSLKGAARAVSVGGVERLAHAVETFLGSVQRGEAEPDAAGIDLLQRALDAMEALVRAAPDRTPPEVGVVEISAELTGRRHRHAGTGGRSASVREQARGPDGGEESTSHEPDTRRIDHRPAAGAVGEPPVLEDTVRVTTAKLDALMALVGELKVAHKGLQEQVGRVRTRQRELAAWETLWRRARLRYRALLRRSRDVAGGGGVTETFGRDLLPFLEDNENRLRGMREGFDDVGRAVETERLMGRLTADLFDAVRETRMFPIATVFDAFPRMVRDLAREQGKDIDLIVRGGGTEVDRSILEHIKDPLTHLLRNAVDHGIETTDARRDAGKPPIGTISLTASQRGGRLVVEVADDGAGIEGGRVSAAAMERGLLTPEAAETLTAREALRLIFRSGLSTSRVVTDLSGRGVGLDVVRGTVERLQGTIGVESRVGDGTTFTLNLPLAIAATRCLLVGAGGQTFAIPIGSVIRIVKVQPHEVASAGGLRTIDIDDEPVTLVPLAGVMRLPPDAAFGQDGSRPAVVLDAGDHRLAVIVDTLVGEEEAFIRELPHPFLRVPGIAGATILATGRVVMVVSIPDVLRLAERPSERPGAGRDRAPAAETEPRAILVADDSITTRTMEKNILEGAGYRVRAVADGAEAWRELTGGEFDLLVSDVVMPAMDGFELTRRVRADHRLRDLPVILITSLDSREDRERGVEVGADAYIVKGEFEQQRLLDTIRTLL